MMTIQNVKRANKLLNQVQQIQQSIAAYREAAEVYVGLKSENNEPMTAYLAHSLTLTSAEIGDQIVAILERRLATMETELRELGVTFPP